VKIMRAPLDRMVIRTAEVDQSVRLKTITSKLNTRNSPLGGDFGLVRSSGHKNHQGWDLYADIGSPVYSVSRGTVIFVKAHGDYGLQLCIKLTGPEIASYARQLGATSLYAFYGHLSVVSVKAGYEAEEGDRLGLTGNSGNAKGTPPHLHFEIRREPYLGKGLHGRVNPAALLGFEYYQCRA
jgi:murein DD-endopeptidase MepM/ murein hydrolase activator NlpD